MRDYKLGTFPESKGSKERSNRPKIKGFGYQVLGFGSGGGVGPPIDFQYLVVAGGGAGKPGGGGGGGGGAGGSRTSFPGGTAINLLGGETTITIGTGGYGETGNIAVDGNDSSVVGDNFTITASGGAGGTANTQDGIPGGSGGGVGSSGGDLMTGGSGNKGGYTPSEGNPGGNNVNTGPHYGGGGGGGIGGAGNNGTNTNGGNGGSGSANTISGSSVTYAGGGGASTYNGGSAGGGGSGGGGNARDHAANPVQIGYPGTDGLGGGAGGGAGTANTPGGTPVPGNTSTGGDGTIILRCPGTEGARVSVTPGTNTKATLPGSDVVCTFTVSGTLKIA